jgi:hypothetical protein
MHHLNVQTLRFVRRRRRMGHRTRAPMSRGLDFLERQQTVRLRDSAGRKRRLEAHLG